MRVCHVSPHLPPSQGANALLPAQLGVWSAADGMDVSYVTYAPADVPAAGRLWRVAARERAWGLARALRLDSWRHAKAVGAVLDEAAAHADVLHLHSNGLIIDAAASWARRRGRPFILTLYGTEIWHYRRRWPVDLFTRAYTSASHVAFYSRRLLDRAKALGLDRRSISVIYPPVGQAFASRDEETRARWRAELGITEPLVVLNVKRLHELAGQKYLIDAFARLARSRTDVRLVICGAGALRQDLERQARESGAGDKITFTGLLPNDEIARYMAAADLFVLPSLLEALPTVAVEALASGTPVVSADHPGGLELNEIFADDVRIVPKGDRHALRGAIDEALRERRRVSSSTLDLVHRHFSPTAVCLAYTGLYEVALKSRASANART